MTTLTIMRHLPREVDPTVHQMKTEDPGDIQYSAVGGLNEQIRELEAAQKKLTELKLAQKEKKSKDKVKASKKAARKIMRKDSADADEV